MMTDNEFLTQIAITLQQLQALIEENFPEIEVDDNQNLTLHFPSGTQAVLSVHATSQQLWLAHISSGAHHFIWKDKWISTKGDVLEDILKNIFADEGYLIPKLDLG